MDIDPIVKITRVTWTDLIDVSLYRNHAENVGARMSLMKISVRVFEWMLLLKEIKCSYMNLKSREVLFRA